MRDLTYFYYTIEELEALKSSDKTLAQAIEKIGKIKREVDNDIVASVIHHIIAQQISSKAQASIWARFCSEFGSETARKNPQTKRAKSSPNTQNIKSILSVESIANASVDTIRACGISARKAEYIIDFAGKVQSGEFDIGRVEKMSDKEAIEELAKLRGVGVWTAEMILLFCLQRRDIFSYDDLAIQRGLKLLYGINGAGKSGKISKVVFEKYRAKFSPHCSLASLYLWEIASGKFEI